MSIAQPYLLFLGDAPDQLAAKTADGVARWRPDQCVGQFRMEGCKADVGLPDKTLQQAVSEGAKTLVIGVANRGGRIGESWADVMVEAIDLGMDIASGLHNRVADIERVRQAAEARGRQIHDVRHPTQEFEVARGTPRTGRRLLTVGTDCSAGKMFTSLAIEREMKQRGMKADFRATGQTGILIVGNGVSVDAVIADFISGAAEWLSPENEPDHWDVVEGQGSLFHASFAGVSLGLLHGSQPDALIMCHEPTRTHMRGLPDQPLPDIRECIALNEMCARLTNPQAKVIGVSVNTSALDESEAMACLDRLADQLGLPCVDAWRTGVGPIVDRVQSLWPDQ